MKRNLSESKPQRWRALVTYTNDKEGLLYLGSNSSQVMENYDHPFFELLDAEEQAKVKSISLQKWLGSPDSGRWETQRLLPVPTFNLPIMTKLKV